MITKAPAAALCAFLLLSPGLSAPAGPPVRMQKFSASLDGVQENIFVLDLNQDGLQDLVATVNDNDRRALQVFFQTADGFREKADSVLRLGEDVILYDFADVSPDPGLEIVGLTPSALSFHVIENGGYRPEPRRWMDAASVLQSPSPDCPARGRLFYELGDGLRCLVLPGVDRTALLFFRGLEPAGEQIINLKPEFTTGTSFKPSREDPDVANLNLKTGVRVPQLALLDFNGDGKKDLISIYKDHLQVFLSREDARFGPDPDFKIDFEVLSEEEKNMGIPPIFKTEAADLNDDGFADVLITKNTLRTSSGMTRLYIHCNRNGQIQKTPDQILMLENSLGFPQVLDLDGDGAKDLVITELKFSLIQIIKILITKKVSYREGIYLGRGGKYPASPNFKLKSQMEFDFDNPGATKGEYMLFTGDFTGDGVNDLLQILSGEKKVLVFASDPKTPEFYSKKPIFEIRDSDLPSEFILQDLNNDKISDIIFDYRRDKKKSLVLYLSR